MRLGLGVGTAVGMALGSAVADGKALGLALAEADTLGDGLALGFKSANSLIKFGKQPAAIKTVPKSARFMCRL